MTWSGGEGGGYSPPSHPPKSATEAVVFLVKDHTDESKSDFVSTLYNSLIFLAVVTIGILILQVGIDIRCLQLICGL